MTNLNLTSFSTLSKTPLVSCVIIFFNNEPFLTEAIESVLGQTYKYWELLLVDDGSTDGSTQTAQRYAQQYPDRVNYLAHDNHQNKGKNASRNLGIQQAKGELIALLDGDDLWLSHKLAEQVAVFQQHPSAGMVYGRSQWWYSWTGKPEDKKLDYFVSNLGAAPNTLVQPPALALDLLEGSSQTPTTCNAILRREVFDIVGCFDENYHDIFEDQAFFIKVDLHFPVFVADNWWARYRRHPGSSFTQYAWASKKNLALQYSTKLKFFNWVKTYLKTQAYENSQVWQYLRQQQKLFRRNFWLHKFPVYTFWINILDILMHLGRQIMPQLWRDWLWHVVGKRLYFK